MDTRRHVSITQPASVAMLGLLGSHVGSQGNRDSTTAGARVKSTLRCSGRRIDTSPPKGCCGAPQRFHLESCIESATWLIHDFKWKRMFTRKPLSREFCKHADSKGVHASARFVLFDALLRWD